MGELDVRFVKTPDYGHGDPRGLCTVRMPVPPRKDDVVVLPGEGLVRWRVDLVEWDLRGEQPYPAGREVAVWVTPA